jgi:transposase
LSNATTLLLGLQGVTVDRVVLLADGTREVHVLTADPCAAGCPSCGEISTSPKQWVSTRPRDLPYGEAPVVVVWRKRRWRCKVAACGLDSFTESIAEVPARARVTGRVRRGIAAAVGDANRAVSEVAAAFAVSWPTAHAALVLTADAALREPEPTPVLGIDETRRGKPRWELDPLTGRRHRVDRWDTGFVDLAGDQGLLGQAEGRRKATVTDWLAARTPQFRAAVRYVVIDPAAVYRSAITTELLPNAVVVVDHFHLVALANDALTEVRRRQTWAQRGRRGRKLDPEWANRRRLLTARGRLSERSFTQMWNELITGDPSGQILTAWIAKEEFRALLALARTDPARHVVHRRLGDFYTWCAASDIPELHRLATTVENWWPEIERFLHTGLTNARTEGINRVIKDVGRRACGFRNPDNHRRRVRFHCTRQSRRMPATPAAKPT